MNIQVGDLLQMKKAHPCGSKEWVALRVGMDFRVECKGCGHQIEKKRADIERNIKKVFRAGKELSAEELSQSRTAQWKESHRED